jgi:hypothetical protein
MEDYENSLCCMDAEQDIIWTKGYLYKKEKYPKTSFLKPDEIDVSNHPLCQFGASRDYRKD